MLTAIEKWSLFIKYAPEPLHRNLINDIIRDREEVGMAASMLREISKDERERAVARSRRMAETDRVSDLLTAEDRGELRGQAKIIELLRNGLTLEEIEKIVYPPIP